MATLLVKFTDESQYNALTSTITYTDTSNPQRWIDVFSKLTIGDNCIFHSSSNKIYVGDFISKVPNVSVTFSNIRVANIALDDFLRIKGVIPETLSVFKRPPGPIYRQETFDINAIYNAAASKDFISFYIVKKENEAQILSTLKENDRVVTIDKNQRLIELYSITNGVLMKLNLGAGYFNAKSKSLDELKALMEASEKKNHVRNIRRIKNALETSSLYKFPSFSDYYNVIHNKSLFLNNPSVGGGGGININGGNHLQNLPNIQNNMALNTILFGPPGTGKTYSTIDLALEILNVNIANLAREQRKSRFTNFQKDNRVFFTTFHQNMAYEDFIEGIKPVEPKEDDEFLKYEIQDGLFMKACIEATYNFIKTNFPENEQEIQIRTFNQLYDQLYDDVEQAGETPLVTLNGGNVLVSVTDQGNFSVKHVNGVRTYTVSRNRLAPLFERFTDLREINNIHEEFRNIIGGCNSTAFWSVLNAIQNLQPNQEQVVDNEIELKYEDKKSIVKSYWKNAEYQLFADDNSEAFVFIIDEINRGNVAQIFGELITLIEEDKRLGKAEEIRLELPYSKTPFCVPPNLYIVGTMNTADKSVEALDTALRRRFSFVPKLPNEEELNTTTDGINLVLMLTKINERLKVLKDSDHTIGHAWLWNIQNVTDLRKAFSDKIIPLLQEYFYNDYEKLGLVLGDNFFEGNEQISSDIFATFTAGNGIAGQYDQSWQYKLKPYESLTIADFQSLY